MSPDARPGSVVDDGFDDSGRSGGDPKPFVLDIIDRDIISMALRGDIDMRRYVPEVMSLCARLEISEPSWMEDESIRERVELNRPD